MSLAAVVVIFVENTQALISRRAETSFRRLFVYVAPLFSAGITHGLHAMNDLLNNQLLNNMGMITLRIRLIAFVVT